MKEKGFLKKEIAKFLINRKYYYCLSIKFQCFDKLLGENQELKCFFKPEIFCAHQKNWDKSIMLLITKNYFHNLLFFFFFYCYSAIYFKVLY